MKFIWNSVESPTKNYISLEVFKEQNNEFNAILYHYKGQVYFYLIYQGESFFDINTEYKIIINKKVIEGLFQFSKYCNDFGFPLDNSSYYDVTLEINIINQYNSKKATSFSGLRNLGATCYINSFIQTLFHVVKFRNDIFRSEPHGKILLLQRLFYNMKTQEYVDPSEFIINLVDDVSQHQDIHEFSKMFFDILEKEYKKIEKLQRRMTGDAHCNNGNVRDDVYVNVKDDVHENVKDNQRGNQGIKNSNTDNTSEGIGENNCKKVKKEGEESCDTVDYKSIEHLIQGHVINYITADCGCKREIKESFQDLQVEIRDFYDKKLASNLLDSFKLFTKIESLDGNNKYKCDKHGFVCAKKGILFADLPPILFILLKRFSMDFETGESFKINDYFEFPESLNLNEFCKDSSINSNSSVNSSNLSSVSHTSIDADYNLYSVIVHRGGPNEGHFYSYINIKGQWYKFNDNIVTKVPKEEVMYMNFGGKHPLYKKKKDFSAYYIVYIKKSFIQEDDINLSSTLLFAINKQFKKRDIRCFDFKDIKNYRGLGFYNNKSYDFPLTSYKEFRITESDTVKMLKNKFETTQKINIFKVDKKLEHLPDDAILEGEDFFIYKSNEEICFLKKKIIFIKIFKNEIWLPDTFPENLSLAFPLIIKQDLRSTIQENIIFDEFEIYKEVVEGDDIETRRENDIETERENDIETGRENNDETERENDIETGRENNDETVKENDNVLDNTKKCNNNTKNVWAKTRYEKITHEKNNNFENGDVFVVVGKKQQNIFEIFFKDFVTRMCVNVFLSSEVCVTLFLKRSLPTKNLEKKIQTFFSNDLLQVDFEVKEDQTIEKSLTDKNLVFVDIKGQNIIYLGYGDVTDYNNIQHIQVFVVPQNITFEEFYKLAVSSNYTLPECPADLRIVDSVKDSLFLKSYKMDETFTSNGMNVIQRFHSAFIKVAFFTGMYKIQGYPFFLFESLRTVEDLRLKYKITERIVKFDSEGYVDLDDTEIIDEYPPETFILIERRY